MNASSSIALSSPSNTISSSCPIPTSSLSTISNAMASSEQREEESKSLTKVEKEQPIPPKITLSSSLQTATTEAIDNTHSTEPAPTSTSNPSVMVKMNNQVSATQCSNCGTTTTPLWRRAPNGDTICNACGLYLKARHTYRPTTMKRNTQPKKSQQQQLHRHGEGGGTNDSDGGGLVSGTCPGGGKCNGTGGSSSCAGCPAFNQHQVHRHTTLMCANCRTTTTPLWRRDGDGNTICNACGLYYKLHNVHRPVSMKRSVIKRRKRLIVVAADGGTGGSVDGNTSDGEEFDQLDHDDDEEHQLQLQKQMQQIADHPDQQHQQEGTKKPRKPYRKRARPQVIDSSGKSKRNRTTESATSDNQHPPISSVPAIEDYIVPKRTIFPHGSATTMPPFSAPVSPSSLASSSVSSSSSFPSPSSASSTPSLPALMQTDHRQQQQQQQQQHQHQQYSSATARLTSSIRNDDNSSSSLSLPPISSERRSAQLNSFYHDNRPTTKTSTSSASSASSASLPPISLPPLRPTATTPVTATPIQNTNSLSPPPMHHPSPLHPNTTTVNRSNNTITSTSPDPTSSSAFMPAIPASTGFTTTKNDYFVDFYRQQQQKHQQQQSDPEFIELEDLDEALKSLKSLRRKVQPEHVRALAQLSKPLWDMVSKAQSIVHGTGALSQP